MYRESGVVNLGKFETLYRECFCEITGVSARVSQYEIESRRAVAIIRDNDVVVERVNQQEKTNSR